MILFLNKGISISKYISIFTIILLSLNLTACGGGSGSTSFASAPADNGDSGGTPNNSTPPGGNTPPPTPGCTAGPASASYTVSWDNLTDPNSIINGYKIYFGTNSQLSRQNATGSYTVTGTATNNNYSFVPANFNLQTCTTYYLAVATLTVNSEESQLSNPITISVE